MHDSLVFCCSVAGLYDELCCVRKSHQMNNLDPTSDLLWLYTYTFLKQKKKKKKSSFNRCPEINVCGTTGSSELTVMSWLEKNGARLTVKVCVCVGWGGAVSDWNSMASSLYSQSLISTYSVHALHTARRGEGWEAAEGYLPDKLLGDTTASFIVGHEARQAGRAPSS